MLQAGKQPRILQAARPIITASQPVLLRTVLMSLTVEMSPLAMTGMPTACLISRTGSQRALPV